MQSTNTQLRVTLPYQLQEHLKTKADEFGLSLSAYVRNLIINDVKDTNYPLHQASEQIEESYKKALKEKPHAIKVNDLDTFFNNL